MCTNVGDFRYVKGTPSAVPPCDQTNPDLKEAGEELMKALESAFIRQAFPRVKARVEALERRIAVLEKLPQDTLRSPGTSQSVSPSKEEEHFLVAPIRGIDEDGRLILGDRKILSASALKI